MNHITTPQLPQWLTTAQAATLSGFSQWQIRKFCRQGVLRATQPSMATTVGRNAPYRIALADLVFSAHAEVVPNGLGKQTFSNNILRARGGSSKHFSPGRPGNMYSPRTRR